MTDSTPGLPRVITEDLGGSALVRAAQQGELAQWYARMPRGAGEWQRHLDEVRGSRGDTEWLTRLEPAIAAQGAARARLNRVATAGGVVVSTGQQAALFGGPLYTIVKALAALGVADALERATGTPTTVVFWAATDDADYEEARAAHLAVSGGLRTLSLPAAERTGIPMSEMPMPGVEQLVDELSEACGSVSSPEALEIARACYTSRSTLGIAYVQQLRAVLEPLGVAVLDAAHPAVRRAAAPVLTLALEKADVVERALVERYDAIGKAGFDAQVEHVPGLSLVFMTEEDGEKRRLPITNARTAASTSPERLSPNVLLRPLVERFIMPSAAYIAGPGELAYFAQVSAVAEALHLPWQLPLPRWSATVLEPRIERLLSRLGIRREELRDRHGVERRLASAKLSPELMDALRQLRQDVEADVTALERADRDGLVPPASVEGLRRSLLHRLERTERRYIAGVKRRED
ncbi:MAG TPA: bacillithiol biosynthesis BshC, partial [Gemmatimonadaceae bacterium]|nr:bacillithiol biosynthesis BshC [Gemmatimonadaceae bacterium]